MSAIAQWKDRVERHHAQSLEAQGEAPAGDFWRPFASAFRADPRRTDDPVLERLKRDVDPSSTVLDVGGGGGRFALPLALACAHVTVVEPSESMLEQLQEGAREAGIDNLTVVQGLWEDIEVEPADIVLCSHVVYGIAEVEPFLRELDSHARERVLLPIFMQPPLSPFSPFWERVHGEARMEMPALPQLLRVLWEMEIYPDLEMVREVPVQVLVSKDAAIDQLRGRLYVKPDTPQDERLDAAVDELMSETPDGLVIRGSGPRREGLISWRPQ